jgi:hypothetical protein
VALFEKQSNPLGDSVQSNGKKRKADDGETGDIGGWAYMGSHNFTPSAWASPSLHGIIPANGSREMSGLVTSPLL